MAIALTILKVLIIIVGVSILVVKVSVANNNKLDTAFKMIGITFLTLITVAEFVQAIGF